MAYAIIYSPEAVDHLVVLPKSEQVVVIDEIDKQLSGSPALETRRRKLLRPNIVAPWQLRLGDIRVFYDIEEGLKPTVTIKAVGKKVHNELWIGGEKIQL